ncbi:CPCC family cysteine-rich protein [Aestuariimicrobium soli]|uniref:CPCC family cysteine-rich protein n=1 Tax=Aestuariimicrobium soli TaxID=2035834 RepID=UPI003EBE706E
MLPCPCCGHLTITRIGYFDLCPVCYWEDDYAQSQNPESPLGANGYSLVEARLNFQKTGASHPEFIGLVRPPTPLERN